MGERVKIVTPQGAAANMVPIADGAGGYEWGAQSGGGGSGVSSFNTRTGAVTLTKADVTGTGLAASDVGADASGAAATAQANAEAVSLPRAGGTMSGAIAMGSSKITGLANGSAASDAAAFGQIPLASSTTPVMDGTAAVGTGTTWAKADHVHPSDTTRAPLASPALTGAPTAPTPAAGDSSTKIATTAFVEDRTLYVNVIDYGAVRGADITTAIKNAITAVTPGVITGQAGAVFIPHGDWYAQMGQIVLPERVSLVGAGMGSTRLFANNTGATQYSNFIVNEQNEGAAGTGASMCGIRDITLDGSGVSGAGFWNCGVVFQNPTPSGAYEYVDARHNLTRVLVQNFTGDGIVLSGRGGTVVTSCVIWQCNGFGILAGTDNHLVNCDVNAGLDGIVLGASTNAANCKAWYCGYKLCTSMGAGASSATTVASPTNTWDGGSGLTFSLANGQGNGFSFRSPGGGSGSLSTLSGCIAQDNARSGFYVRSTGGLVLAGCIADSNNNNSTSDGTATGTPVGSYAGFDVDGPNGTPGFTIDGFSFDRAASVNRQAAALHINSTTGQGRINLQFYGLLNNGTSLMPPLLAGDQISPNFNVAYIDLRMNCQGYGFNMWSNAVDGGTSGTYNPDPLQAETIEIEPTGAVTIANPYTAAKYGSGQWVYDGMRMRLVFQQGATAYPITFGAAYKVTCPPSITPNTTSALDFVYDGSNWVQVVPAVAPAILTGTATLVAGAVTVSNANTTANTIIRLMTKTLGGTPGALFISAKTAATSFTIKSTSSTDTSVVYYEVVAW